MALERAAELTQRDQLRLRDEAGARHDRVERGDGVTLREDHAITVGPVGALRIDTDLLAEVERDEQVDDRVRAARMSGARVRDHADDLDAALARDGFELRGGLGVHQARSSMKLAMASTRTPETAISGV